MEKYKKYMNNSEYEFIPYNKFKSKSYRKIFKKGGMISQYPLGGILPPEVDPNESYIFPDQNPDFYNQGISPINSGFNPRLFDTPSMSYLPQNNKLIDYQPKLNPVDTNPTDVQKLAENTPDKTNPMDYISPAFNTLAAGISLFSKGKNYLEKPDTQALSTLESINTEPDNTQLYNRNLRTLRAANANASNLSPSIRNSLLANNLGTKLNADNEIGFATNKERLDRETDKKIRIAQLQDTNSKYRQAAKHQFNIENNQDKQAREEGALTYLGAAASDISSIGRDKELGEIYKQGLKYYTYDASTGKYIYKNNLGNIFYSSIPPSAS